MPVGGSREVPSDTGNSSVVLLQIVAVGLFVSALWLVVLPFFNPGFPFGHDLSAHLTYTHLFDRAFHGGQFPVRWTHGVTPGHGQPLFNFYQPGFYYAVALIHVVVPSLLMSVKVAMVAFWLFGAAMMFRALAHYGPMPAALGTLVFAGSPYFLLDLYVRASYPELAAISCAVGALCLQDSILLRPSVGRLSLMSVLIAGAIICHLPTTLIFFPVFAVRALVGETAREGRARGLLYASAAAILGMALALFYVGPAVGEQHLIQLKRLTSGYFDYHTHFVRPSQWLAQWWGHGNSVPGGADEMPFQVGLVEWLVLGCATVVLFANVARRNLTKQDKELIVWLALVLFALFMTTAASARIWGSVPAMAYLQYPWRFLMLVGVACGFLAANLLARLRMPRVATTVLIAAAVLQIVVSSPQRQPSSYVPRGVMNIDRPNWPLAPDARTSAFFEAGYSPIGAVRDAVPSFAMEAPFLWTASPAGAMVKTVVASDRLSELDVTSEQGAPIVLGWTDFPGWTFSVDGRPVQPGRDPATGFIRIEVPPGRHRLRAEFRNTPIRYLANAISAVTLLLLCVLGVNSLTNAARRHWV